MWTVSAISGGYGQYRPAQPYLAHDRAAFRAEGKPEAILEKIAMGKLNKFYKEKTLLNQQFVKDSKKSVSQYLKSFDSELTVTDFKHISLA